MITFWVDRAGAFGIQGYLGGRGKPLRERFTVRRYEFADLALEVPGGPQIFAALDQLSDPERRAVVLVQTELARVRPEIRVLNDPRRTLLRPALLARMAEERINRFRAYPAHDHRRVSRFPVFLRGAHDHNGSLTDLLWSAGELRHALRAARMRGNRLTDLMIVEFCDSADRHGIYRKYAAWQVGGAIVPSHLLAGRNWVLKREGAERTLEFAREDLAFVEGNPHETWLREVFELAGVGYGRADYGVLNGRPQLWEINLNPTMGRPAGSRRPMTPNVAGIWERARELAHARLREAFVALDGALRADPVTVRIDPGLRSEIARARRKKRRRQWTLDLLGRAYDSFLGAPFRAMMPRLAARN